MKIFIALFALVAAVSAFPGYEISSGWHGSSAWQPGWQPQSVWPSSGWPSSGWPSSGWQSHSAWQPAWQPHAHHQHHAEHVHVEHVHQAPAIPALHPHPLKLEAHNHVVKIPLHAPKPHHPHLIGVEHYHEPEIHVKPVHGHGW